MVGKGKGLKGLWVAFAFAGVLVGCAQDAETEMTAAVTTATGALTVAKGHPDHAIPHHNWRWVGRPKAPDCSGAADGGLCECGPWRPPLIDNFEDGDTTFGRDDAGIWFLFNDGTGAQLPTTVEGLIVPSPLRGNRFAARSSGEGFSVWGAGFGLGLGCAFDVGRHEGVRFKVKAGGVRHFFLEVPTLPLQPVEFGGRCTFNCNDYHRASIFLTDDAWYECTVPFATLAQAGWGTVAALDLGVVTGFQYNLELPDSPYDLTVDDIELVRNVKTAGVACVPVPIRHCGN